MSTQYQDLSGISAVIYLVSQITLCGSVNILWHAKSFGYIQIYANLILWLFGHSSFIPTCSSLLLYEIQHICNQNVFFPPKSVKERIAFRRSMISSMEPCQDKMNIDSSLFYRFYRSPSGNLNLHAHVSPNNFSFDASQLFRDIAKQFTAIAIGDIALFWGVTATIAIMFLIFNSVFTILFLYFYTKTLNLNSFHLMKAHDKQLLTRFSNWC